MVEEDDELILSELDDELILWELLDEDECEVELLETETE